MTRFVQCHDRRQDTLLPGRLEDYVSEENPVRVVDAFVEQLDLGKLGFAGMHPEATGRPAYHPATLLKIYLYGYLNRVQSSRRLERETQRNVELMWLTGRLMPDFKTIANFRKDNGPAIRGACRQFMELCRQLKLFSQALVAVDGSKFKAVNNRDRNFTVAKVRLRMEHIEASINRYMASLDTADQAEAVADQGKSGKLKEKIAALTQRMQQLKEIEAVVQVAPDKQISLTDPDARSMATSAKGRGIVGYNVQTAVDAEHHLIIAHEVTNVGNDRGQLANMAQQAQAALDRKDIEVVADRGYFKGEEILACQNAGITPFVPKPLTSGSMAAGRFGKQDFVYSAGDNTYRCPAGELLTSRFMSVENGMTLQVYWTTACPACPMQSKCTTGKERRVKRWEHEGVLEAMQQRLDQAPEKMQVRQQTVEHPFGTIKMWMGSTHFLTKTLGLVSTEMSLHVLAYNLRRLMTILGVAPLVQAMQP
jgi:transposase/NACalpha-BTF3-like transcription factor